MTRAFSGRDVDDVTLDAVRDGDVFPGDVRIHPETLRAQARTAREHGNPQLAENFERAAELTALPDEEVLALYELLRPGRATAADLEAAATRLESVEAHRSAALFREAATTYTRRHLLHPSTPPPRSS